MVSAHCVVAEQSKKIVVTEDTSWLSPVSAEAGEIYTVQTYRLLPVAPSEWDICAGHPTASPHRTPRQLFYGTMSHRPMNLFAEGLTAVQGTKWPRG